MTHPVLRVRSKTVAWTAYFAGIFTFCLFFIGIAPFLSFLLGLICMAVYIWLIP